MNSRLVQRTSQLHHETSQRDRHARKQLVPHAPRTAMPASGGSASAVGSGVQRRRMQGPATTF